MSSNRQSPGSSATSRSAGAASLKMSPVAVFVVVMLGGALAGVLGAIFAIPVGAAILAITDYLRQRDVLLRASDGEVGAGGDVADVQPPLSSPADSA